MNLFPLLHEEKSRTVISLDKVTRRKSSVCGENVARKYQNFESKID